MESTCVCSPRPVRRDGPAFSPRTNPNSPQEPDAPRTAPAERSDARYPDRCSPNRTRPPLDETQQGLATRFLPLARSMARKIARSIPHAHDDLQSAAYMALVEAAQTFDPSRSVHFSVYARHRIQGALRDARRESLNPASLIANGKLPRGTRVDRDPDGGSWIFGAAGGRSVGAEMEDHELVQSLIGRLPRLQSLAFRLIYLEGKTQEEAAAHIGCSAPTMSRLHREAIATIQYSRALR